MAGSSGYIWWSVMVMLVSGTFSAIATKVLYQLKSDGVCHENKFGKSYMFTLWMFIGEAMCLATYYFRQWQDKPSREKQALLDAEHEHHTGRPSHDGSEGGKQPPIWVYVILSCFDLSATAIGGVGLLYVNASTNQMLRGSGVLFTGLFTILILKRRLSRRQWGGILMVIVGLGLVGGAASLQAKLDKDDGKEDKDNTASPLEAVIGVILVLVGAALNSAQGVFEEKLMKASGAAEVDPLKLVGWEGISGTVLSSFLLLPVAEQIPGSDCGKAENTTDSLIQMYNRPLIALVLVLYAFCLALMNYYSQVISKELSAVHRMLVSTLRTVLVWIVGIITYYYISRDFGESWVVTSYMQLGGFVALFVGTFIYGVKPAEQKEAEPLPDVVSDHQVQHTTY